MQGRKHKKRCLDLLVLILASTVGFALCLVYTNSSFAFALADNNDDELTFPYSASSTKNLMSLPYQQYVLGNRNQNTASNLLEEDFISQASLGKAQEAHPYATVIFAKNVSTSVTAIDRLSERSFKKEEIRLLLEWQFILKEGDKSIGLPLQDALWLYGAGSTEDAEIAPFSLADQSPVPPQFDDIGTFWVHKVQEKSDLLEEESEIIELSKKSVLTAGTYLVYLFVANAETVLPNSLPNTDQASDPASKEALISINPILLLNTLGIHDSIAQASQQNQMEEPGFSYVGLEPQVEALQADNPEIDSDNWPLLEGAATRFLTVRSGQKVRLEGVQGLGDNAKFSGLMVVKQSFDGGLIESVENPVFAEHFFLESQVGNSFQTHFWQGGPPVYPYDTNATDLYVWVTDFAGDSVQALSPITDQQYTVYYTARLTDGLLESTTRLLAPSLGSPDDENNESEEDGEDGEDGEDEVEIVDDGNKDENDTIDDSDDKNDSTEEEFTSGARFVSYTYNKVNFVLLSNTTKVLSPELIDIVPPDYAFEKGTIRSLVSSFAQPKEAFNTIYYVTYKQNFTVPKGLRLPIIEELELEGFEDPVKQYTIIVQAYDDEGNASFRYRLSNTEIVGFNKEFPEDTLQAWIKDENGRIVDLEGSLGSDNEAMEYTLYYTVLVEGEGENSFAKSHVALHTKTASLPENLTVSTDEQHGIIQGTKLFYERAPWPVSNQHLYSQEGLLGNIETFIVGGLQDSEETIIMAKSFTYAPEPDEDRLPLNALVLRKFGATEWKGDFNLVGPLSVPSSPLDFADGKAEGLAWICRADTPDAALEIDAETFLEDGQTYIVYYAIKNNGKFDSDTDITTITDPVALYSYPQEIQAENTNSAMPAYPGCSIVNTGQGKKNYDLALVFFAFIALCLIRTMHNHLKKS